MEIKETLNFFTDLKNKTKDKSELNIYRKFIAILLDLKHRDLTKKQIESIESKLSDLNLKVETDNRKKHFNKKLSEFETFLKEKLSLISDGYYTLTGMVLGIFIGSLLSMYIGIHFMLGGMFIGMIIGLLIDSEAKKQGRVLKTKFIK